MDTALATNKQLVEELMKRSTFAGIVILSSDEQKMDTELATNKQLVEELMKRSTFAGIIILSSDEQKFEGQIHDDFCVYSSGDMKMTTSILESVLKAVQ